MIFVYEKSVTTHSQTTYFYALEAFKPSTAILVFKLQFPCNRIRDLFQKYFSVLDFLLQFCVDVLILLDLLLDLILKSILLRLF